MYKAYHTVNIFTSSKFLTEKIVTIAIYTYKNELQSIYSTIKM